VGIGRHAAVRAAVPAIPARVTIVRKKSITVGPLTAVRSLGTGCHAEGRVSSLFIRSVRPAGKTASQAGLEHPCQRLPFRQRCAPRCARWTRSFAAPTGHNGHECDRKSGECRRLREHETRRLQRVSRGCGAGIRTPTSWSRGRFGIRPDLALVDRLSTVTERSARAQIIAVSGELTGVWAEEPRFLPK
jgi:hypothetical protein